MDGQNRAGALTPTDTRAVIRERRHNAFTDIVYWRDRWYVTFRAARRHFADQTGRIVILRSADLRTWERVAELKGTLHAERGDPDRPGASLTRGTRRAPEVRDPKFAVVGDTLFLYALLNRSFDPVPYATVWTSTSDGERWTPLRRLSGDWLMGRPQRWGSALCAPAHRFGGTGEVALLRSDDGVVWHNHSTIHRGDFAEESALAVLPDGAIVAATRAGPDSIRGSREACTILSRLEPGARLWVETGRDYSTRLDGPALFVHAGAVYAVGRTERPTREERPTTPRIGSAFARKRTALFLVTFTALVHRYDLPSAGDTGYAGVALADNRIAVSYYTTSPRNDIRWIYGMLSPSEVRIVELVDQLLKKPD